MAQSQFTWWSKVTDHYAFKVYFNFSKFFGFEIFRILWNHFEITRQGSTGGMFRFDPIESDLIELSTR